MSATANAPAQWPPTATSLSTATAAPFYPSTRGLERRSQERPVRSQGQQVSRGDVAGERGRDTEAVELTGPEVQDRCFAPRCGVGIHEEARSPAREQLRPDQDPRHLLAAEAHVLGRCVDRARRRRDDRAVFAPAPPEVLGDRGHRLRQLRHQGELLELSGPLASLGHAGGESDPEAVGRERAVPAGSGMIERMTATSFGGDGASQRPTPKAMAARANTPMVRSTPRARGLAGTIAAGASTLSPGAGLPPSSAKASSISMRARHAKKGAEPLRARRPEGARGERVSTCRSR